MGGEKSPDALRKILAAIKEIEPIWILLSVLIAFLIIYLLLYG